PRSGYQSNDQPYVLPQHEGRHWVALRPDEYGAFAELSRRRDDSRYVVAIVGHLLQMIALRGAAGTSRSADLLLTALQRAALIGYSRCFMDDDAFETEFKSTLDDNGRAAHERFRWLRSKHVAHSLAVQERVDVLVLMPDEYTEGAALHMEA